jgi:hypothetical protein
MSVALSLADGAVSRPESLFGEARTEPARPHQIGKEAIAATLEIAGLNVKHLGLAPEVRNAILCRRMYRAMQQSRQC